MLRQLLHLLEENEGQADLAAISRSLEAQPSAVTGMLETLIRKGKVIEIVPDCGICADCALSSQCALPSRRIRRYQVVGKDVLKSRAGS